MSGRRLVRDEYIKERGLVGTTNPFEIENLAEIGVGAVGDVDEVGLDETFWRVGADL